MDLIVSCIDFNVCFGEGYISIVFLLQSLTGMYIFITIRQNVAEIVTVHGTDCKSETVNSGATEVTSISCIVTYHLMKGVMLLLMAHQSTSEESLWIASIYMNSMSAGVHYTFHVYSDTSPSSVLIYTESG